jgi:hypothetical protein
MSYVEREVITQHYKDYQYLTVRQDVFNCSDLGIWCYELSNEAFCKKVYAGVHVEGVNDGHSYFIIGTNGKMRSNNGHHRGWFKDKVKRFTG